MNMNMNPNMNPGMVGGAGMGRGGYRGGRGRGGGSTPASALNIRISNAARDVDQSVMRRVFESVGVNASQIDVYPREPGADAFVLAQFFDPQTATRAKEALNGFNIYDNSNTMHISYARQPQAQQPQQMAGGAVLPSGGHAVLPVPAAPMGVYPGMQPQVYPSAPTPGFQPMPYGQQPGQPMMVGMPYGYPAGVPGMRGGRGGVRGGRGATRGGRGGAVAGFNPMMAGGYMAGGMPQQQQQQQYARDAPTVFVSVTVVPETEPLQNVFVLLEAFGGIFSMRRNQKQKTILTVKTNSPEDTDNIVRYLRRVPFAGGTVSAKRFPAYTERNPCTDEGVPTDPETTQYDFTASRHRSPGQRSKATPSRNLKITGCAVYSVEDVASYLRGAGFEPRAVTKDEADGSFAVEMADTATAVRVLIACHGAVCSEERSNVIFVEGPADEAENNEDEEGKKDAAPAAAAAPASE